MALTAVVIGGGIGGLSAAVGLHRAGWDVTVLERVPVFRPVGAGLVLQANGMRCLDVLGLGDAVRALGHRDVSGGTRRADGAWLARIPAGELERVLGTSAIGVHRADLHDILLGALPAGRVKTGAPVTAVTAEGAVTYDRPDGPVRIEADLVVGADGVHSVVRRLLWPRAAAPVRVGVRAWRGVTPAWDGDLTVAISWDRGAEFGIVPLAGGRVSWFAAVNAAPSASAASASASASAASASASASAASASASASAASAASASAASSSASSYEDDRVPDRFFRWHHPIPALIAATGSVLRDDLTCLDEPLPTYVRGRVALLGDAAHAMTPNLGQGANQALEDAVVLATFAGRPGGLATYDRQRRPRSQQVAKAARMIGRFGQQLENPFAVAARNTLMRLTPPRLALRSMARYADWIPPAPQ